ncbi:hypothetical protein ASG73_06800 [Janibacter sp. Soil728]|uniref:hypothetical protein n=1 Tax=Janibacter sp. Soil728 TaxID=1736393 RepID=UPI0006F29AAF|nr:hypothetical protein [Janibacter sp. Soil728]KRE37385.1 hypothetical protein ASG73_06800 [Janibacter sp. Soil728]
MKAALIVAAMIAAVVVTRFIPQPEQRATVSYVRPAVAMSSTPASTRATRPPATSDATDAQWQSVARSFISRYGNQKGGRVAWLKRLRPVVSQAMWESLHTVRLANLPTGTFGVGEVLSSAEVGGTMRFPLRGGEIGGADVTVSVTDEGLLRVTGLVPVRLQEVP